MKIYSSENCPQCMFLKKWLKEKGYSYEEVTDPDILGQLNIQSIPQLQLDDGRIISYREALAGEWMARGDSDGIGR